MGRILFSLDCLPFSLSIPQSSSLAGPIGNIVDGLIIIIISIVESIVDSFTSNNRLPRCSRHRRPGDIRYPDPQTTDTSRHWAPEARTPSLDLAVITAIRSIRRLSTPASPPICDLSLSFFLSFAPKGRTPHWPPARKEEPDQPKQPTRHLLPDPRPA
ncbi:hypothetical protein HDV57DRAFT_198460 [Trichoderma longibrachiatum]